MQATVEKLKLLKEELRDVEYCVPLCPHLSHGLSIIDERDVMPAIVPWDLHQNGNEKSKLPLTCMQMDQIKQPFISPEVEASSDEHKSIFTPD